MTPDDLEERIRAAMPASEITPRPALWDRVEERLQTRESVNLVFAPVTPLWPRVALASAIAAMLTILVWTSVGKTQKPGERHSIAPQEHPESDNFFLPGPLLAQSSDRPSFRAVDGPIGERLRPGRWTYITVRSIGESIPGYSYARERAELDGRRAWLLTSGSLTPRQGWGGPDTLWATATVCVRCCGSPIRAGADWNRPSEPMMCSQATRSMGSPPGRQFLSPTIVPGTSRARLSGGRRSVPSSKRLPSAPIGREAFH